MEQFDRNSASSGRRRRPAMAAAAAVLLVGGVAFAAGGGIEKLKSLFVTVEIDGEPVALELTPVADGAYEGQMTREMEDGRQANIHVRRFESQGDADEKSMEVRVNVGGDDGIETEDVEKIVRKRVSQTDLRSYALEDLDGAEPIFEREREDGSYFELFMLPQESGQFDLVTVDTDSAGESTVRLLGSPRLPGDVTADPVVTEDADGTLTLSWDEGDGRVIEIKLRTAELPRDAEGRRQAMIRGPGSIRIGGDDAHELEIRVAEPQDGE